MSTDKILNILPLEIRNKCIVKNGVVYTPEIDIKTGKIIKNASEVANTGIIISPSQQEKINAQLLKSNLEFQKALAEQKKVNANLLLQIQSLQKKEGNN